MIELAVVWKGGIGMRRIKMILPYVFAMICGFYILPPLLQELLGDAALLLLPCVRDDLWLASSDLLVLSLCDSHSFCSGSISVF